MWKKQWPKLSDISRYEGYGYGEIDLLYRTKMMFNSTNSYSRIFNHSTWPLYKTSQGRLVVMTYLLPVSGKKTKQINCCISSIIRLHSESQSIRCRKRSKIGISLPSEECSSQYFRSPDWEAFPISSFKIAKTKKALLPKSTFFHSFDWHQRYDPVCCSTNVGAVDPLTKPYPFKWHSAPVKVTIFFDPCIPETQIIGSSRKKPQETFTKRISLPCTVALGTIPASTKSTKNTWMPTPQPSQQQLDIQIQTCSWIFGKKACATIIHWRKQISHHTLQNFASCLVFSIKSSKASRALVGFPKCREMDYLSYSREICLWPCPNKEAKIKTFSQHQPILIQNLEVGQPSKQWSDGTHLSPPISR